jgi:hypothetical protein
MDSYQDALKAVTITLENNTRTIRRLEEALSLKNSEIREVSFVLIFI